MGFLDGKFAGTVKVGEKGQIVIPKEARDMFGIKPGDTLLILGDSRKGLAIPPREKAKKLMERAFLSAHPVFDDDEEDE